MQPTSAEVYSIHDSVGNGLAFDLKDLLRALDSQARKCVWWLDALDCVGGEKCQAVCQAVEESGGLGLWMPWAELAEFAGDTRQTIEGELLGFSADIKRQSLASRDLDLGAFPSSQAILAIVAVDSSHFEVYAKSADIGAALRRHFREVRVQDPSTYFYAAR